MDLPSAQQSTVGQSAASASGEQVRSYSEHVGRSMWSCGYDQRSLKVKLGLLFFARFAKMAQNLDQSSAMTVNDITKGISYPASILLEAVWRH